MKKQLLYAGMLLLGQCFAQHAGAQSQSKPGEGPFQLFGGVIIDHSVGRQRFSSFDFGLDLHPEYSVYGIISVAGDLGGTVGIPRHGVSNGVSYTSPARNEIFLQLGPQVDITGGFLVSALWGVHLTNSAGLWSAKGSEKLKDYTVQAGKKFGWKNISFSGMAFYSHFVSNGDKTGRIGIKIMVDLLKWKK